MKSKITAVLVLAIVFSSCVSKKKYTELEDRYQNTKANYVKLQTKFDKINNRIEAYNTKINSLNDVNTVLEAENMATMQNLEDNLVLSKKARAIIKKSLSKVDPKKLEGAKTLRDSLNVVLSYNIVKNALGKSEFKNLQDIDINVEETEVKISISEKLLFNSGSYKFKKSGLELLTKLADVIEAEPSIDVMVEGHADSKTIKTDVIEDNWDLSVKRATTIVRILQNQFKIDGSRLIASGRGDTMPLYPNTTEENRSKNRRTKIILLPNLNKFLYLLSKEGVIE